MMFSILLVGLREVVDKQFSLSIFGDRFLEYNVWVEGISKSEPLISIALSFILLL